MIIELISVLEQLEGGRIMALVDVTRNGETLRLAHVFPPDTMEWRSAEYDIDPGETDLLLDIVLYEPHIQLSDDVRLYRTDKETAKKALLDAVQAAKVKTQELKAERREAKKMAKADVDAEDAREMKVRKKILDMSVFDEEVMKTKKSFVTQHEMARLQGPPTTDRVLAAQRKAEFKERGKERKNG